LLYALAKIAVFILSRFLFRIRWSGEENIPRNTGVILASNHVSYLDIPLMACGVHRRVDFMGKEALFKNPLLGGVFRILGGFPIRRGEADRRSLEEALRRLKDGRIVAVYPEGTRSRDGELQAGKPGIGMLALLSQAPVVPVYIQGTWKWWRFRPVVVTFGRPVAFSPSPSGNNEERKRPAYERASREIMAAIGELRDSRDKRL
jgi:1-acyl-sn-glycerol-3-phosphate acyltransferase